MRPVLGFSMFYILDGVTVMKKNDSPSPHYMCLYRGMRLYGLHNERVFAFDLNYFILKW